MKGKLTAILALALLVLCPRPSFAQNLHGFATVGVHEDINKEYFPGVGGGIVLDLLNSWVSAGGQGDLFFSNGYVGGRGGPIGQFHFVRHGLVRPFAVGGYVWGVVTGTGPTVGGGLETWSQRRLGFRASAQVYPISTQDGGKPKTSYPVSIQFGISWR